jgi:NADH-quinone oxidoreductase subunit N
MITYIHDYHPLYSYLLLVTLAFVVAVLGTVPALRRVAFGGWLTAFAALAALALDQATSDSSPWQGMIRFDGFSRTFNIVFLITLAVVAIGSAAEERKMAFAGEYYALLMLSTIGLMLMASAGGLLILYLGLELSTICLFALVGFEKREKRSAEAALKMLVLGAVASAVILYGASILYGVFGSVQFDVMARAFTTGGQSSTPALLLGLVFVIGGIGFKIAAVPFHLWAPDVYEGAPAMVSAFLSTASKAGGFAALLRFLLMGMGTSSSTWQGFVVVLAALSMVVGNLVALTQTNFKRLLAYSGIAQAGYILVAVAAAPGARGGMSIGAVVLYLLLYALTNVGGFLLAQAVADATGSDDIAVFRGLHRRSPPLAFAALVVLFSLGGIPPLAGFVGKLYLFAAGWQGGQQVLVVIGALTSVIALYYYLMVARQVYINAPEDDRRLTVARPLRLAIAICVAGILVIGIYPRPWIDLGDRAAAPLQNLSAPQPIARLGPWPATSRVASGMKDRLKSPR